jgi:transcriptional regulator with XRE-family HTH domain
MTGTLFDIEDFRYAMAETYLNAYVAIQIRELRQRRGWSQAELAQAAGLHQAQISDLENVNWSCKRGNPNVETLRKVARALEVRLRISYETWSSAIDEICSGGSIPIPVGFEDDEVFKMAVEPSPSNEATNSGEANP